MTMTLVIIFIVAYAAIAFEHPLGINKSASALIGAGLLWTVYALALGDSQKLNAELGESVMGTAQIVFFLVGAMTIVTLETQLADKVGSWVTVLIGVIFVVCVLAFRRGIVGAPDRRTISCVAIARPTLAMHRRTRMVHAVSNSKDELISLPDFVERLSDLFPRLCRALVQRESNDVTTGRVTLPQFWALEILKARGPQQMHELVDALRLKASTGTVFVDRLADMGLVRRVRATGDRRVVQVVLAAKGTRLVQQIHEQRKRGLQDIYKPLTAAERADYLHLVEKLLSQLDQPCPTK